MGGCSCGCQTLPLRALVTSASKYDTFALAAAKCIVELQSEESVCLALQFLVNPLAIPVYDHPNPYNVFPTELPGTHQYHLIHNRHQEFRSPTACNY